MHIKTTTVKITDWMDVVLITDEDKVAADPAPLKPKNPAWLAHARGEATRLAEEAKGIEAAILRAETDLKETKHGGLYAPAYETRARAEIDRLKRWAKAINGRAAYYAKSVAKMEAK